MDETLPKISELQRLLSGFPAPSQAEPDEVLRRYLEAVQGFDLLDVREAVSQFLRGAVPDHNAAFAPSSAELAIATRRVRDKRLDAEEVQNRIRRQLTAIEWQKPGTSETRAAFTDRIMKRRVAYTAGDDDTGES